MNSHRTDRCRAALGCAAALVFVLLSSLPRPAAAYTDKWVSVPGRDVHLFTREGVVWGLIIDTKPDGSTTSSGKHEVAPTNFVSGGGVQVVNNSAASLALTLGDGSVTTVPAGGSPVLLHADLINYAVNYGTNSPGQNDRVLFNELAPPMMINGALRSDIVDFSMLIDLGGGALGQPGMQVAYRRAGDESPTPFIASGSDLAFNPLTASGKFMLIEVPEPGAVALATCGLAAIAMWRRRC